MLKHKNRTGIIVEYKGMSFIERSKASGLTNWGLKYDESLWNEGASIGSPVWQKQSKDLSVTNKEITNYYMRKSKLKRILK